MGLRLRAGDAVNAGGAAGGPVDAGAAVLGAAAGRGAQHSGGVLTTVSTNGVALGKSAVGLSRGATEPEASEAWEGMKSATKHGQARTGALHGLGVRI